MAVNRDKPDRWKRDIAQSVDMYNDWFMRFAPKAYRTTRVRTTKDAEATLGSTRNLTNVGVELLRARPSVLPSLRMSSREIDKDLEKIGKIIERMADPDVLVWLERGDDPSDQELYRAATIVADRLCGAVANPIIRNAQEKRQLAATGKWLAALGYRNLPAGEGTKYDDMRPGTFSCRLNVPVEQDGTAQIVNIPVDAVVMPKAAKAGD